MFTARGKVLGCGMTQPCCLPSPFLSMELTPCPGLLAGRIWTPLGAVLCWGPCHPSQLVSLLGPLVRKRWSLQEGWWGRPPLTPPGGDRTAHIQGTHECPSSAVPWSTFACQTLKWGRKAGKIRMPTSFEQSCPLAGHEAARRRGLAQVHRAQLRS